MRIVIAGGSGQVGQILARYATARGDDVAVLARGPVGVGRAVAWDGSTLSDWARVINGADVVINLAGRSVNCRYTEANLREMLTSRVGSTRVVGAAISACERPPKVWLQMSTATIYAHRFDAANGETDGAIGGSESGVPGYWARSVDIAKAWEQALADADTPRTRKVALRTAMVMSSDKGGIFDVMLALARRGLGGSAGDGRQFVSWVHGNDFARAVEFLVVREDIAGPVNVAAPGPLPYAEFMRSLRKACGARVGLPATKWMLEIGAWAMRTDTELVLKSRRVVPERLLGAGFSFTFPEWPDAAQNLVAAWRAER
jgi:hypothetical protein